MSLFDSRDTLAHQLARPLCVSRDMSGVTLKDLGKRVKEELTSPKGMAKNRPHPHVEAARFYLLQHATGVVRARYSAHDVLDEASVRACEAYHRECGPLAARTFYYLLLICLNEAAHVHNFAGIRAQVRQKFGRAGEFLYNAGCLSATDVLSGGADVPVGEMLEAVEWIFRNGKFGPAYGGPLWGDITRVARYFVDGTYSPEMMLDTVFTLQHNTCKIFNKGHVFRGQDEKALERVLDVQASGQIPSLVRHGDPKKRVTLTELKDLLDEVGGVFGELLPVDEKAVSAARKSSYFAGFDVKPDPPSGVFVIHGSESLTTHQRVSS